MHHTIVFADNDRMTAQTMAAYLADEMFEAVFVDDGATAQREIGRRNPSLVVLGTNFADVSGLDLARWLMSRPYRPGLILLSSRSDPIDRTIYLEMGADDCLSKPFFARELLARIHSVLRRIHPPTLSEEAGTEPRAETITASGFRFNPRSRQVCLPHGALVTLSRTEAKVLSALLDNRGAPMTRDMLSLRALGRNWNPDDRALDQHIAALRRKLETPHPGRPLISTVRHVGYMVE